jgi:hypothetical protein
LKSRLTVELGLVALQTAVGVPKLTNVRLCEQRHTKQLCYPVPKLSHKSTLLAVIGVETVVKLNG